MPNRGKRKAKDPIPGVPSEAKPLRIALFLLTVASAAAALFLEPALAGAVNRGALASVWLFLPMALYVLFFLAYAVDRWMLVRRRRYPGGKAFFQIAFGLVFAMLLLPSTIGDWSSRSATGIERLLRHPDGEVRLVAVEALGFRGLDRTKIHFLTEKLDDRDSRVVDAAMQVLARWADKSPKDLEGIRAWALESSGGAKAGEGVP